MKNGRIIIGSLVILIGLVLGAVYLFVDFEESFVLLIYGIPLLILGIVIFLNKKEDVIEQIKRTGGKK